MPFEYYSTDYERYQHKVINDTIDDMFKSEEDDDASSESYLCDKCGSSQTSIHENGTRTCFECGYKLRIKDGKRKEYDTSPWKNPYMVEFRGGMSNAIIYDTPIITMA